MGKIRFCIIQEFMWRFVLKNRKKINEIDNSREGFKLKRFWKIGMDKESEFGFSDVFKFSLSKPILLRGVRTRNSIRNTMKGEVIGKGTFVKLKGTITLEKLDWLERRFSVVVLSCWK